jgi:hypothetical protein
MFAILAAGVVDAVGNTVTVLANNLVTGHMIMIAVLLVGSDDLEVTVNNHEGIGVEVHDRFAAGFVELSGHGGSPVSCHFMTICAVASVK